MTAAPKFLIIATAAAVAWVCAVAAAIRLSENFDTNIFGI